MHEAESLCHQQQGVRKHVLLTGVILCYLRHLSRAPTDLHSLECTDIEGS